MAFVYPKPLYKIGLGVIDQIKPFMVNFEHPKIQARFTKKEWNLSPHKEKSKIVRRLVCRVCGHHNQRLLVVRETGQILCKKCEGLPYHPWPAEDNLRIRFERSFQHKSGRFERPVEALHHILFDLADGFGIKVRDRPPVPVNRWVPLGLKVKKEKSDATGSG